MPTPNLNALQFLQSRRSRPAKTLGTPVPDRAALQPLLTAAARTPDHGKLEPWRFIVIEAPAMARLADVVQQRGEALGLAPEQITKGRTQFDQGQLAVVVVEVQKPSEKIPPIEQSYSRCGLPVAAERCAGIGLGGKLVKRLALARPWFHGRRTGAGRA